jgi:beta-aspartyl-peptidase (threonine type)
MSTLDVRRARREDAPALGRLGALLLQTHYAFDRERFMAPRDNAEEGYARFLVSQLDEPDSAVFVAEREGQVVGYVYAALEPASWKELREASGFIHDIAVEESSRRQGIAEALLRAACDWLKSSGAPRVVLGTAQQNYNAQRLFERLGFRRTMVEMTKELLVVLALGLTVACTAQAPAPTPDQQPQTPRWGMVIHTGAGAFTLENLGERQAAMRAAMTAALNAGHAILARGGSSMDAVEAAVVLLEDSPEFNAGKGAVFTNAGTNELDASIMDGRTHRAGAVARLRRIRNPIRLARLVMERSPHVMMVGDGAEVFAQQQGMEFVDEKYFFTERAWQALQRAQAAEKAVGGGGGGGYYGTVGAVALDQQGNLAAATSTGGLTNKRFGRVGDSPIIGAGTYASNQSCGISSTGTGEFFIRFTVAHDICARVQYAGTPVQQAADAVVQDVLKAAGGDGGVVGLDRLGNVAMSFNTTGMGRGYVGQDGRALIMFTAADAQPIP